MNLSKANICARAGGNGSGLCPGCRLARSVRLCAKGPPASSWPQKGAGQGCSPLNPHGKIPGKGKECGRAESKRGRGERKEEGANGGKRGREKEDGNEERKERKKEGERGGVEGRKERTQEGQEGRREGGKQWERKQKKAFSFISTKIPEARGHGYFIKHHLR